MIHQLRPSLTETNCDTAIGLTPKTRFLLATTIAQQSAQAKMLEADGFKKVGTRQNPGTWNQISLWWKKFPALGRLAVPDAPDHNYHTNKYHCHSTWCCGLRMNSELVEFQGRMTIAVVDSKRRRCPKGWRYLGGVNHEHFYVNGQEGLKK
jgi:hypothetical protein